MFMIFVNKIHALKLSDQPPVEKLFLYITLQSCARLRFWAAPHRNYSSRYHL